MNQTTGPADLDRSTALSKFLQAPVRAQTYKNLAYLALQFPLGLAYFVFLVPALAFGLGTLPLALLFGLPILGAIMLGVAMMTVDRAVTGLLLPVELDRHTAGASLDDGVIAYVKDLLFDPGTYLSIGFVLVKFVVGVTTFVVLTVTTALVGAALAAPFVYDSAYANYTIELTPWTTWVVDTLPEALVLAGIGVAMLFVAMNVLNVAAWGLGQLTAATCQHARVLGGSSGADPQRPAEHA